MSDNLIYSEKYLGKNFVKPTRFEYPNNSLFGVFYECIGVEKDDETEEEKFIYKFVKNISIPLEELWLVNYEAQNE